MIEDVYVIKNGTKIIYTPPEGFSILSPWLTAGKTYTIKGFYDTNYGIIIVDDSGYEVNICYSNVRAYFTLCDTEISKGDAVNHPSHYTWLKEKCGIEVIDITRHLDFDLGNAIKYILRAGRKPIVGEDKSDFHAGTIQDLKKAIWYLNDKIKMLEKNGG